MDRDAGSGASKGEGRRLVAALIAAEVMIMLGSGCFAAQAPTFIALWSLSAVDVGLIEGAFQIGNGLAAPVAMVLADRIDPRRIYRFGCWLTLLGNAGFALFASDVASAILWRAVTGVGLAATYLPGVKLIGDRLTGAQQARGVAFYTSVYSAAIGVSMAMTGLVATSDPLLPFWIAAAGGAVALVIGWACLGAPSQRSVIRRFDPWPAIRNRPAVLGSMAYGWHCWELMAVRAWLVVFLVEVLSLSVVTATALAAAALLVQMPASLIGNEVSLRIGRRRWLLIIMPASAVLALITGAGGVLPVTLSLALVVLYMGVMSADSAALTAGVVALAEPETRGATLALHAALGGVLAGLGPPAVGLALELSGSAWLLAFAVAGAGALIGAACIAVIGSQSTR
ncbi:MAG: MFS transporter [Alphaproteobacteria bacterium]|nr:MAG: MFS transporter [Alphaproteobacteria bacterium]